MGDRNMNVVNLIERVKTAGGRIAVVNGRLRLSSDQGPLPDELVTTLREHKRQVIEVLQGKPFAIKMYSEVLGEVIFLISTEEAKSLADAGCVVYTFDEIERLIDMPEEGIRRIHQVKRNFPGSRIEN